MDVIETIKTSTKINAPFGYFGSKNKIALKLCHNLPPHNCWVEAFCGSAALTLAKPAAQIEVINDIDNEIVNLFEQLRNNSIELKRAIELTPYAEQELILARSNIDKVESKLEKARRFLIQSMMAINGAFGNERGGFSYSDSYSRGGKEARVNRWNNLPARLESVVKRLKNVRIENKDGRKLFKRYLNRPATLVYLDPPYLGDRSNSYNIDANDENFHIELLEMANRANCMVFISGYEKDIYNSILSEDKGWTKRTFDTSTKGSTGTSHQRTEVLWMNYAYNKALATKTLPINLTKKEETQKKINPER